MLPSDTKCELLDEYHHGSLDPELQEQFQHHLGNCASCAAAVSHWQTINTSLQQSFESISLPDPERFLELQQKKLQLEVYDNDSVRSSAPSMLALAALLVLAVTVAMTWYITVRTHDSGLTVVRQQQNTSKDDSTIYADAVFDEKTMAVRKCDDPEITVYQVYPKITLRSVE